MKYVCFGYLDVQNWETKSETERSALIDECFTDDDALQRNGNWVSGGLQSRRHHFEFQEKSGVCDRRPYTETKDLLGGVLILGVRDLNHAIQLISNHTGIKMGPCEIRPVQA